MNTKATLFAALFGLAIQMISATLPVSAQVREVGLQEMVSSSGMIFVGTVTEVRGGLDENGDISTWTTFRVETPLRGVMPGQVTIKQYGGSSEEGTMYLSHMRYFSEGERVMVMLYPPSDLGYTSPIGMGQGAWTVSADGKIQGLTQHQLQGLSELANAHGVRSGEVPLSSFIQLVHSLSGEEG